MRDRLFLAWKYLSFHRFRTAVLVGSIALIVFVPAGLQVLLQQGSEQLHRRAAATPLLLGRKGSSLELVLNSLYFQDQGHDVLTHRDVEELGQSGLAQAIPLHVRFHAHQRPIVGTRLEYFEFRGLRLARGRPLAVLGECVIGSQVAAAEGIEPGDHITSSPENVLDLAGVYPLRMQVVGVLEPSFTPDDEAVFVDLKTAWVIEGLGHGHQDLGEGDPRVVLRREDDRVVANASLVQYEEITPDNLGEFHFHGDLSDYPVTAVIAVPTDAKHSALLQGRYQSSETRQLVRPERVMDELLGTVLTVQGYVVAALVLVGLSTLATSLLVYSLSLRLRRREIETLRKIGVARSRMLGILALEVAFVLGASLLVAAALTVLASRHGAELVQRLLLS